MRSLSSTDALTPSTWRPSRRVVSNTSTRRCSLMGWTFLSPPVPRTEEAAPEGGFDVHGAGPRALRNDDDRAESTGVRRDHVGESTGPRPQGPTRRRGTRTTDVKYALSVTPIRSCPLWKNVCMNGG